MKSFKALLWALCLVALLAPLVQARPAQSGQLALATKYWQAVTPPLCNGFMFFRMKPEALKAAGLDSPAKLLDAMRRIKKGVDVAAAMAQGTAAVPLPPGWKEIGREFHDAALIFGAQLQIMLLSADRGTKSYDKDAMDSQFEQAERHLSAALKQARLKYGQLGGKFSAQDDVVLKLFDAG